MGRIKKCRVCEEILYCKSCGERQTPEAPDWQQVLLRIRPEKKAALEKQAKKEGITMNEFIRRRLLLDADNGIESD